MTCSSQLCPQGVAVNKILMYLSRLKFYFELHDFFSILQEINVVNKMKVSS